MKRSCNFPVKIPFSLDVRGKRQDTVTNMKTSNKFTFARVIFAPIFFLIYNLPLWLKSETLAFASALLMIPLLAVFELTDYFDGHYARKSGEVSDFGKIFDPFADVMLNLTVFLCAFSSWNPLVGSYMPVVIFVLIMYREFSQNFLRMVAIRHGVAIAARSGGKFKTVFYITSGFVMLTAESAYRLGLPFDLDFTVPCVKIVIMVFFVICVLLSYISFADYLKNFSSVFKKEI